MENLSKKIFHSGCCNQTKCSAQRQFNFLSSCFGVDKVLVVVAAAVAVVADVVSDINVVSAVVVSNAAAAAPVGDVVNNEVLIYEINFGIGGDVV